MRKKYSSKNRQTTLAEIASGMTPQKIAALLNRLKPSSQKDVMRTIERMRTDERIAPALGMDPHIKTQERSTGEES